MAYHVFLVAGLLAADVLVNTVNYRLCRGWHPAMLAAPIAALAAGFWLW